VRPEPDAGFSDVEAVARERMGLRVHWNGRTADDEAAAKLVRDILARELTADGAVQVALLNNRELQATYERLGIAQAELVKAGLPKNPVLSGDVRFGSGTGVELSLVEDFLDLLLRPLRLRVASAEFERAKLEVTKAVLDTAADTREAFFAAQGAEERVGLWRSIAQATGASAEMAHRIHAAGNLNDLDFANEEALHAQALLDLAGAVADAEAAREKVTALMGLWGHDVGWRLVPKLPELPKDEVKPEGLESLAVAQRPDLAALRQEVLALSQSLGAAGYGVIPEVNLGANGQREIDGTWTVGPGFDIPIPLFNQGQAAILRAEASLRQSREQYAALAIEVRSQTRAARTRLFAARDRANFYRRVLLPLRQRIVRQTQRQYNSMLTGVFQLLAAKRDEIEAARQSVEALKDYWMSSVELERAVGGKLPKREAAEDAKPSPSDAGPTADLTKKPGHHNHGG
jgi:cobalt-zinc-cadmium efflux system outer membrane protein